MPHGIEETVGYEPVDLLPSEILALKEISVQVNRELRALGDKYFSERSLANELIGWAERTTNRYREAGFVVFVDPFNKEVGEHGEYISPIVSMTGKVKNEELDHDQFAHEVQHGLLDGVEGKINEKGVWLPPDTVI